MSAMTIEDNCMKTSIILAALIGAGVASPTIAEVNGDTSEITMNVVDRDALRPQIRNAIVAGAREIIVEHLLADGIISEDDVADRKATNEALREELRALREAGDKDGIRERLVEVRAERADNRAQIREYVADNEDLRQELAEYRESVRARLGSSFRDVVEGIRDRRQNSGGE